MEEEVIMELDGTWEMDFDLAGASSGGVRVGELRTWTQSEEPAIRYHSGTCTYRKEFFIAQDDMHKYDDVVIDLGEVHELAGVMLNARDLGVAWHPPFRVEATGALRVGRNRLEIRVANLWVNRLIGDRQPGQPPVAFTTSSTYRADAPLRASGLLGPVTVRGRTYQANEH
jgi:hypothetical protein